MDYKEQVVEAVKVSPPVTVGTLTLLGVTLADWVIVLTFVYVVLQLYFLLRDKWWRDNGPKG